MVSREGLFVTHEDHLYYFCWDKYVIQVIPEVDAVQSLIWRTIPIDPFYSLHSCASLL